MQLRKVKPEDAAVVAELCGQLGYPASAEDIEARLDAIGSRPDHRLIGAELDGKLIGWAHVHADWALDHGFEADLLGLVVHEEQRGLGIGRALIGEAAEWAVKHHCTRMRVRTNVIRMRAGDFYRRAGFKEVKRQLVLDLTLAGTDANS
ncbi:MAG TPA: GNAT family N-acetyltransferase [Vicinamibacterales bacterium]|nr:GNAT family N-acetyltransferase [Vicinamibacterales bacterium]